MLIEERIRGLCAQLFWAKSPVVIETVAAHLHAAIDQYVQELMPPCGEIEPISAESSAPSRT
jgi:hypothetical protein